MLTGNGLNYILSKMCLSFATKRVAVCKYIKGIGLDGSYSDPGDVLIGLSNLQSRAEEVELCIGNEVY